MAKARPVTAVHVDIARLAYEVSGLSAESSDKWLRDLVKCLVLRDPSIHAYGAFLLSEVEEYRKSEIERKRRFLSEDSTDSKEGADSLPRQSIKSNTGKKEKKIPPTPQGDPWFAVPAFSEAWSAWIAGRKKKPTVRALELSIQHLREMAGANMGAAVRILEQSTANGWTGLFPLKGPPSSRNGHASRGLSDRLAEIP